jgi:hypothetical protein
MFSASSNVLEICIGVFFEGNKMYRWLLLRDVRQRHISLPFFAVFNKDYLTSASDFCSTKQYIVSRFSTWSKKTLLYLNIQLLFHFIFTLQRYDVWHYAMYCKWIVKFQCLKHLYVYTCDFVYSFAYDYYALLLNISILHNILWKFRYFSILA